MYVEITRYVCGTVIVLAVVGIQLYAWEKGKNGKVFAFTTSVIGSILGFIFGISV